MAVSHSRDYLQADLAALESLLARMPADRFLERAGLEARRLEVLRQIQDEPETAPGALVELIFGGDPVVGSMGVDAQFGVKAVGAFQRAVTAAVATGQGTPLGTRGPLPESLAHLHITDVVRGRSFGFRLEEIGQLELGERSRLTEAIGRVEGVLESLNATDSEAFSDAVADVDQRVVTALKEFMLAVSDAGAVCRVVSEDREVRFTTAEIAKAAAERISSYEVSVSEDLRNGILWGVLPEARRFEFHVDGIDEFVKGRISRVLRSPQSLQALMGKRCTALIRTTIVRRAGAEHTRHMLRDIFREGSRPSLFDGG